MMRKVLKFEPYLADRILSGEKTTTWRFYDDKDLTEGDQVVLATRDGVMVRNFCKVKITKVIPRTLATLEKEDWEGHGQLEDPVAHYRKFHGKKLDENTPMKIVKFEVIETFE